MVSSRSQTATSTSESRNDLPYRSYYSSSELPTDGGTGSSSGPASLSMSVDIHNLVGSPSASSATPCPPSPDPEGPTTLGVSKSDPEEEEESYEGFGYGDGDSPGSSAPSPTRSNPPRDGRSPPCNIGRHSWLRTSLRRTPPSSGNKRLGSNALASQLYRSSSFNSSGRGSTCDTADEIYSDVSLEDDVLGLSHKGFQPMHEPLEDDEYEDHGGIDEDTSTDYISPLNHSRRNGPSVSSHRIRREVRMRHPTEQHIRCTRVSIDPSTRAENSSENLAGHGSRNNSLDGVSRLKTKNAST